jgi:hypothetical protein
MTCKKKPSASLVRTSSAESLTFVAATGALFEDSALEEGAVLRNLRTTACGGTRYDAKHDSLSAIDAAEKVSWKLAGGGSTPVDHGVGPSVLGSLSERRSSSATPTRAANIAPRSAFNSAHRDPARASARSQLLGSTARRTSPKHPGPGAIFLSSPTDGEGR